MLLVDGVKGQTIFVLRPDGTHTLHARVVLPGDSTYHRHNPLVLRREGPVKRQNRSVLGSGGGVDVYLAVFLMVTTLLPR